jgi:hypothetical protein
MGQPSDEVCGKDHDGITTIALAQPSRFSAFAVGGPLDYNEPAESLIS